MGDTLEAGGGLHQDATDVLDDAQILGPLGYFAALELGLEARESNVSVASDALRP